MLSTKAKKDLRVALNKSYGENFEAGLHDEDINNIGCLLLTIIAESVKLEIANPELFVK